MGYSSHTRLLPSLPGWGLPPKAPCSCVPGSCEPPGQPGPRSPPQAPPHESPWKSSWEPCAGVLPRPGVPGYHISEATGWGRPAERSPGRRLVPRGCDGRVHFPGGDLRSDEGTRDSLAQASGVPRGEKGLAPARRNSPARRQPGLCLVTAGCGESSAGPGPGPAGGRPHLGRSFTPQAGPWRLLPPRGCGNHLATAWRPGVTAGVPSDPHYVLRHLCHC